MVYVKRATADTEQSGWLKSVTGPLRPWNWKELGLPRRKAMPMEGNGRTEIGKSHRAGGETGEGPEDRIPKAGFMGHGVRLIVGHGTVWALGAIRVLQSQPLRVGSLPRGQAPAGLFQTKGGLSELYLQHQQRAPIIPPECPILSIGTEWCGGGE